MKIIKIGISSCLLGENVRYDGGNRREPFLADKLSRYVKWIPVCPEVECGLPVPREPMMLTGDPENSRLVTVETKADHTERFCEWTSKRLEEMEKEEISAFIFKSRSPSCGINDTDILLSDNSMKKTGGIFSKAFVKRFPSIPVIDEGGLQDDNKGGEFIIRVLGDDIWKQISTGSKFR